MMQIIANGIFCKLFASLFIHVRGFFGCKVFPCAKGVYDERFLGEGVSAEGLLCFSVLGRLCIESVF